MTKFRQHRGQLAESLATTETCTSLEQLRSICQRLGVDADHVRVEPYIYDHRIAWDTHIVMVPGYGVVGFTD